MATYPILLRDKADLIEVLKQAEQLHLIRFTREGKTAIAENS